MKVVSLISAFIFLLSFKPVDKTDYRKIFGDDYIWAVDWLRDNNKLIAEYAAAFAISAKELKAIVFPELIRYNGFVNALEVESLKYLYVNEGKHYADFSVGYFQMKPSFAEMIEQDVALILPRKYLKESGWNVIHLDETESRRLRVQRLSNIRQQLIYLCAFYKFCQTRFKERNFASPEDRVRLFATCYNAGYTRSYESLLRFQSRRDFFNCNYSAVSVSYYRER